MSSEFLYLTMIPINVAAILVFSTSTEYKEEAKI